MIQFLKRDQRWFTPSRTQHLLVGLISLASVSEVSSISEVSLISEVYARGSGQAPAQATASSRPAKTLTSSDRDEFNLSNDERAQIILREVKLGERSFKAGVYRDALRRFTRVYRLYPKPVIIYNMARCFEELHEYDSAVFYYQRYLKESPDSNDRETISLTIETLKRLKQKRATQQTPPEQPVVTKPVSRTLPWTGVAVGGSMLITSAVFGIRALSLSDDLSQFKAGGSLGEFYQLRDSRDQSALFADIFMISGAVLSGVSLYFLLNSSRGSSSSDASESASPSPAQAETSKPLGSVGLYVGPTGLSISGVF